MWYYYSWRYCVLFLVIVDCFINVFLPNKAFFRRKFILMVYKNELERVRLLKELGSIPEKNKSTLWITTWSLRWLYMFINCFDEINSSGDFNQLKQFTLLFVILFLLQYIIESFDKILKISKYKMSPTFYKTNLAKESQNLLKKLLRKPNFYGLLMKLHQRNSKILSLCLGHLTLFSKYCFVNSSFYYILCWILVPELFWIKYWNTPDEYTGQPK